MKGNVDLLAAAANENEEVKYYAPFRSCISKIKNTLVDNAEDLDIAIFTYLLQYSHNYCVIRKFVEL